MLHLGESSKTSVAGCRKQGIPGQPVVGELVGTHVLGCGRGPLSAFTLGAVETSHVFHGLGSLAQAGDGSKGGIEKRCKRFRR